jgi:hypothetical protein
MRRRGAKTVRDMGSAAGGPARLPGPAGDARRQAHAEPQHVLDGGPGRRAHRAAANRFGSRVQASRADNRLNRSWMICMRDLRLYRERFANRLPAAVAHPDRGSVEALPPSGTMRSTRWPRW